jgi:hypothetical protein
LGAGAGSYNSAPDRAVNIARRIAETTGDFAICTAPASSCGPLEIQRLAGNGQESGCDL